jgi:predicted nucleotidyltransferase
MRLSCKQLLTITETAQLVAGEGVRVSLFGSRLDDTRKGGDVDLLIESKPAIGLLAKAKIKLILEKKLNLPVDIIATDFGDLKNSFVVIAKQNALCLNDFVIS